MHYILFAIAFLFFVFIAPLKTSLTAAALLLVVTFVVKIASQVTVGATASLGESFKAVAYSFLFLMIALLTLISFSKGSGIHEFADLSTIVVLGGLLVAYILGFKVALGVSFGASALVAFISTMISALFLWVAKGFFSGIAV